MNNTRTNEQIHMSNSQLFQEKVLYKTAMILLIIGGIHWGIIGAFQFNIVKQATRAIRLPYLSNVIYMLVGAAAVFLAFKRDTYLPFLGDAVYPCQSLADKVPDQANISVTVRVPPGSKVVYWASEHAKDMEVAPDPWKAYGLYENSGVVTADAQGDAILKIRDPIKYKVPIGARVLEKHLHYRYCKAPGMLSSVETAYL